MEWQVVAFNLISSCRNSRSLNVYRYIPSEVLQQIWHESRTILRYYQVWISERYFKPFKHRKKVSTDYQTQLHSYQFNCFHNCKEISVIFNNINSQLGATFTNVIDNYNRLNMFRAIISPILRNTRLCLQHRRCCLLVTKMTSNHHRRFIIPQVVNTV